MRRQLRLLLLLLSLTLLVHGHQRPAGSLEDDQQGDQGENSLEGDSTFTLHRDGGRETNILTKMADSLREIASRASSMVFLSGTVAREEAQTGGTDVTKTGMQGRLSGFLGDGNDVTSGDATSKGKMALMDGRNDVKVDDSGSESDMRDHISEIWKQTKEKSPKMTSKVHGHGPNPPTANGQASAVMSDQQLIGEPWSGQTLEQQGEGFSKRH
ncbi:hypothetical protein EGW08_016044, partial [Elysia chlorotica]